MEATGIRHVAAPEGRVVAAGLAASWTAAAFLAGGFFPSTRATLALAAISGLVLVGTLHGLRRPSASVLALALLAGWTGVSGLWGASHVTGATLLPVLYAATVWLAEQSDLRSLARALRVAILLVAAAAVAARMLELPATAGQASHRLQWPITYANGLGVVAATGVLLWLLVPVHRPIVGWAAVALCAVAGVMTYSRGASLGLVLALISYAILSGRVSRPTLLAAGAALSVTVVLAGPVIVSGFGSSSPDSRDASRLFSLSGHGREALWREAWRAGTTRPLTGIGPGNFRTSSGGRLAHSLLLQTFVDLGAVGVSVLLAFLLPALRTARGDPLAFSVVVLWGSAAAIDWVWELPACTIPAMLVIGGAVRRHR